ncbi:DUF6344 domain-containing protein [Streptomyces sp. NPDC001795]|uniref:DUF6344 domain-containing protein n=1 Tax=unclassified Streptomyces TaxID=2593676 RepID=UPI00332913B7
MARNKVMKLWTAVVTAFLALCTALGFVSTTATAAQAAVPQTQPARNTGTHVMLPRPAHGRWSRGRSLPPTMKQRIHAEAHGSAPACRHRRHADTLTAGQIIPRARRPLSEPAGHLEPPTHLRR